MNTLFKSENGKKEIIALYDEKLKNLKISYNYLKVKTSFGNTNIINCGDPKKPPILLIHGSNGCAPIAIETYKDLLNNYNIYAVDVLAQPNKSDEVRLSMKDNSYGIWVQEIVNDLELKNVTLAGFSFGGLIILKTLEYSEQNIKEVFLTAPAYIVNGNPLKAIFKVFIPMKKYMKTKKHNYLERFLDNIFTDKDKFAVKFLSKVFLEFEMDFTPVPVIKKKNAKQITTPITIFAAEKDILFPGNKMVKRAKKIFPSLKKAQLINNSKHVQNEVQNSNIALDISNK